MRSISKRRRIAVLFTAVCVFLTACGKTEVPLPYGSLDDNRNYAIENVSESVETPFFAAELAAAAEDRTDGSGIDAAALKAACVYDLDRLEVAYAYHAYDRLSPASLTKLMTALIVLENCPDLSALVTIGDVTIQESGAQLFGLKEGDRIKVRDLLYVTLIYSANDGALALAQYVAGSTETFVELMNARAEELGATGTHFVNPHGLTAEGHYTTAYDLYLIFNAAAKHEEFLEIVRTVRYTVDYTLADGSAAEKEILTTNRFLTENYRFADEITIVGGKTGSTNAAGKCIILYALDGGGHPYIAVVMGAEDVDGLYRTAKELIEDTAGK